MIARRGKMGPCGALPCWMSFTQGRLNPIGAGSAASSDCQLLLPSGTVNWYCCPDPPAGGYGIDPAPLSQSLTAD